MTRLRIITWLCIAALCVALGLITGWSHLLTFADEPIFADPVVTADPLVVERGDSFQRVVNKLKSHQGVRGHPLQWRLLAHEMDVAAQIKVGEYALEPGLTPRQLLIRMRDGKVISHRFTIVEGWNMRDLRAALARARPLVQSVGGIDDAELMVRLDRTGVHPEGRFLPETYTYVRGDSDLDLLRQAADALDKTLAATWRARASGLPLHTPEDALILASIIEKETGVAAERTQIAGVFTRRLKLGMRLQTDPTVIYGMGSAYSGNIRRVDLQTDTPYNTYTRAGLPPTPIAMPGAASLHAAVHPAEGDALYFVAVGDGSGRHVFSRTLAEHNRAVAAYVRRYREQFGRKNLASSEAMTIAASV